MIKIERVETFGWETAVRGMRNPLNSWEKSDSLSYEDDDVSRQSRNRSQQIYAHARNRYGRRCPALLVEGIRHL